MIHRSERWLEGKIAEFFADTSRSPEETDAALERIVQHIKLLQENLKKDKSE